MVSMPTGQTDRRTDGHHISSYYASVRRGKRNKKRNPLNKNNTGSRYPVQVSSDWTFVGAWGTSAGRDQKDLTVTSAGGRLVAPSWSAVRSSDMSAQDPRRTKSLRKSFLYSSQQTSSINQSINQSINRSIDQSIHHSIYLSKFRSQSAGDSRVRSRCHQVANSTKQRSLVSD